MSDMKGVVAVVVALLAAGGVARAQNRIALDEIVGSWQADDEIQYVELRMLDPEQNGLANVAALVFDDATGSDDGRRTLIFTGNVARGLQGAKILVATTKARERANLQPDFLMPTGFLHPKAGRICYAVNTTNGLVAVDCVAYGAFTGTTGTFGPPTPRTPDNRALQRVATSGRNRTDWTSVLDPVLENNAGGTGVLPETLCGDVDIEQGEECDGTALGGATCASLGFVKGKLTCVQCHYDTSACTMCGNDAINGKEECDGTDLGDRSCASLGYTGGTLGCSEACKLDLSGCDPTFFAPGGGPPKTDCLGEWLVTNTSGGPDVKGKVAARQSCKDGNAGCDADGTANGTCLFTVAACFARMDARFAKCVPPAISGWMLTGKVDPADPSVTALVTAVAALGTSTVDGVAVTFSPPLAVADFCSAPVQVAVPAGRKLVLRGRTAGPGGKPKDADLLRLACTR
jgi:hypothetical protein